jgi:PIN domain nuclease of toxin-antitoxin system
LRLLLDTHTILWIIRDDPKLPSNTRSIISNADQVYWSIISIWEIAIKLSLDRSDFQLAAGWAERITREMEICGFLQSHIATHHLENLSKLPWYHRDPFDRLLIATAKTENLTIISRDPHFQNYDVELIW